MAADSSDPFHWVGVPVSPLIDKQLAVVLKLNVVNCCPVSQADSSVRNETKARHVSSALHLGQFHAAPWVALSAL